MLALLLVLPAALQAAPATPARAVEAPPTLHQVLVAPVDLRRLLRLDMDVAHVDAETGEVAVLVDDDELQKLTTLGFDWRMQHEDVVDFYRSRLTGPAEGTPPYGAWLSPAFGSGSLGSYYTWTEVVSILDQMRTAYPSLISARASIGQSIEGRDLWMVKISDNPDVDEGEPEVRIDALHHAREPQGMQATLWFMLFLLEGYGTDPLATYLVDEREIYFVPVVNPDGYVYNQSIAPGGGGMWRKNRRVNGGGTTGVDLNRNYPFQWGFDNTGSSPTSSSDTYRGPAPASEPEVQAMTAFLSGRNFQTALSVHTYSNLWLHAFGYDFLDPTPPADARFAELSALATEVNGYLVGPAANTLYPANGVTLDYDWAVHGTYSWTPEIGGDGDGFWPPPSRIVPLAEENLLAFQRTALAAGPWVRVEDVQVAEVGDGDGFYEAGEAAAFTVTVRNSGLQAPGTSAVATLSSTSAAATIGSPSYDFGALAPFTSGDNSLFPLTLDIAPGTPAGTVIDWSLELTYDGAVETVGGSVFVGQPIALVADELDLDYGWIAGVPGDTATTGQWERGAPLGTSSGGSPVAPGADNTPGAGGACFVTGNGGGSAGTDDVDNGGTTLITPALRLAGVGPARISYARWFADFTQVDDALVVSISDDDGASWTTVETITGNQNQWNTSTFEVGDFVGQTDAVRLRFYTEDVPNNSFVEAAVDSLSVEIFDAGPRLAIYGEASPGAPLVFNVTGQPGGIWFLFATSPPSPAPTQAPTIQQAVRSTLRTGGMPASRVVRVGGNVPSDPALAGQTLYYRAAVVTGGTVRLSNVAAITVQ